MKQQLEDQLESLDLETKLGDVTLSNGQSLDIPKLSMFKIIRIVKFLGIDGSKLYSQSREILMDESLEDLEKFAVVLETLEEKQLIRIFSIALDQKDEDVLRLDPNEMLEILLVYVEELDLKKTYSLVRSLLKKMFNKELPETLEDWLSQMKENQKKKAEMKIKAMEQMKEEEKDGEKSLTS